jgi:murein DD-endopeptidase MepM/ murein hydrolase activator NlpD
LINPLDETLALEAAGLGAEFVHVSDDSTGIWQFTPGHFYHPLAMAEESERLFMIDGGRVLLFDLTQPASPRVLLKPGDQVEGVPVIEPLDLFLEDPMLYVLDRAGDVYRYDIGSGAWSLDRYDRPIDDASGHYYVAASAADAQRYLAETTYGYILKYGQETEKLWQLPEGRVVDLGVAGDRIFVLMTGLDSTLSQLLSFVGGLAVESFEPLITFEEALQLIVGDNALYVLDRDGRRLTSLDPETGEPLSMFQLPQDNPVSAFAVDENGALVLAGRDRLYFLGQPDQRASIDSVDQLLDAPQPFDIEMLAGLGPLLVPIGGSDNPHRDLQMPGAPRHYRLGVHAGADYYWHTGTQVRTIAAGTVIRADLDFVPPSQTQFNQWHSETARLGYTPENILDHYRGRQVWVAHDDGFISRYGHLAEIDWQIFEGARLVAGQAIGTVGNSGSPLSVESEEDDAHLHFELWLGDHYLGQYLRPIEIRMLLDRLFQRG